MSKGFAIEFSAVTFFSEDGDEHNTIHRFRVLVKDEAITAYVAYAGPFGEGWARIVDDEARATRADLRSCSWTAPCHENRVIALAFDGYHEYWAARLRARVAPCSMIPPPSDWSTEDKGLTIIDIGTIKREA